MKVLARALALFAMMVMSPAVSAQQRSDPDFVAKVETPHFEAGTGPVVAIDQAHANFHTMLGRYRAFTNLLTADGYRVEANDKPFSAETLAGIDVLVIANALHPSNSGNWRLPVLSAFTADEISSVHAWVENGGRLLLIADHMPFPGAAAGMADTFGFGFKNGFAVNMDDSETRFVFRPGEGLAPVPGEDGQPVGQVVTFTGQAFSLPQGATSLLTLHGPYAVLLPREAWKFEADTPLEVADGLSQGAILEVGNGRIAAFGKAAAFSAQISSGGGPMGMNAPDAADNATFILAVMHWLTR